MGLFDRLKLWLLGEPPDGPTPAEQIAAAAFRNLHPAEAMRRTQMLADESERFVVAVFYGEMRPTAYMLFAVSKTSNAAEVLDDASYSFKHYR